MQSFLELAQQFETKFNVRHFPKEPQTLYDAAQYILAIGGKRVRPVCVLMGNELFADINQDAWQVAAAIELFHNFSLIHDDIMDKAPLRRGMQTVHAKYGDATALLAGDVMFAQAYDYLTRIDLSYVQKIIKLFNQTSKEVCEGQQIDMDFEQMQNVGMEQYIQMITLKKSVLLAASLQLGAILGGAGEGNQQHIYSFGKNLGIAFQIQDDYLDAFGDPEKFGKQIGGDILSNKKTFLLLHAIEVATANQKKEIDTLISTNPTDKVEKMLTIYKDCKVDVAVLDIRKKPLYELATYLMERES